MKTFKFYGVCGNCYKLDDTVFEAIEDPSDGYRSYLSSIELVIEHQNVTFSRMPLAFVNVVPNGSIDGWNLKDAVDGHIWLEIGTDHTDDYYPFFIFRYTPKEPLSEWEKFISGED